MIEKTATFLINLCSLNLRAQTVPNKSERDFQRTHTSLCPTFFISSATHFRVTFSWSEEQDIFGSKFPLENRAIINAICVALIFELRRFRKNPSRICGENILLYVQLFPLLPQTRSECSNRVFFGVKKKIEIRNNVV